MFDGFWNTPVVSRLHVVSTKLSFLSHIIGLNCQYNVKPHKSTIQSIIFLCQQLATNSPVTLL